MEPVLTKFVHEPNSFTLDVSLTHGAYEGLRKALTMQPGAGDRRRQGVGAARAAAARASRPA